MRVFVLISIVATVVSCTVQTNQEKTNSEGEEILVGLVNWEGLTMDPYKEWFTPNYLDYQVDVPSLELVKPALENVEIVLFLGSWCSDSQVQVPQFYKMLDYIGYDIDRMKVYALEQMEDRKLVGPNREEEGYNITHVPTIIFYKNGVELARIVEYPRRTIEKDMVEFLVGL